MPAEGRDPGAPEPEPEPSDDEDVVHLCDLRACPMIDRHCKLVCPGCGYQRDCSDP